MGKKLSVCIPTYNRLDKLEQTVAFFIEERVGEKGCELIVSDNCSGDGTAEYLSMISKSFPEIRINRNKTNLGLVGNVMKLVEIAHGDYVWIAGDDDQFVRGAVDEVLAILNRYPETAYILLQHDQFGDDAIGFEGLGGYYESSLDLFTAVSKKFPSFGPLMFISASIHKRKNYVAYIDMYRNMGKVEEGNLAMPLGASLYSSSLGCGYLTERVLVHDNCRDCTWATETARVAYRDKLAILDKVSSGLGSDVEHLVPALVHSFRRAEFYYLKNVGLYNNYAMRFYLKRHPLMVLSDGIAILKAKLGRSDGSSQQEE